MQTELMPDGGTDSFLHSLPLTCRALDGNLSTTLTSSCSDARHIFTACKQAAETLEALQAGGERGGKGATSALDGG